MTEQSLQDEGKKDCNLRPHGVPVSAMNLALELSDNSEDSGSEPFKTRRV